MRATPGADFHPNLFINHREIIFRKGENKYKEEFSGFANPELNIYLKSKNISNTFVVGLAYDFCAGSSALDSALNGFNSYIIRDACKGIFEEKINDIEKLFIKHDVKIINSEDLVNIIQ